MDLNFGTIEALKTAGEQVTQFDKESKEQQPSKDISNQFLTGFAEKLVQKLISINKEKMVIEKELAEVEKTWSELGEKKKKLESRRGEILKIESKIAALNKELEQI